MAALSERIVSLRKEKGLDTSELAKRADVNYTTLYRIENSTREPSVDTLIKIAQGLNMTVSELIGETGINRTLALPFNHALVERVIPAMEKLNRQHGGSTLVKFLENFASLDVGAQNSIMQMVAQFALKPHILGDKPQQVNHVAEPSAGYHVVTDEEDA